MEVPTYTPCNRQNAKSFGNSKLIYKYSPWLHSYREASWCQNGVLLGCDYISLSA
jgi:hypothetical protein